MRGLGVADPGWTRAAGLTGGFEIDRQKHGKGVWGILSLPRTGKVLMDCANDDTTPQNAIRMTF